MSTKRSIPVSRLREAVRGLRKAEKRYREGGKRKARWDLSLQCMVARRVLELLIEEAVDVHKAHVKKG